MNKITTQEKWEQSGLLDGLTTVDKHILSFILEQALQYLVVHRKNCPRYNDVYNVIFAIIRRIYDKNSKVTIEYDVLYDSICKYLDTHQYCFVGFYMIDTMTEMCQNFVKEFYE